MGQRAVALMLGVKKEQLGDNLHNDDSGEWIWDDYPRAEEMPKPPRGAYKGGAVGFKVACSAPDDDEDDLVPYDLAIALAEIPGRFAARIEAAQAAWVAWAAWLEKAHGHCLPTPKLLITCDERA